MRKLSVTLAVLAFLALATVLIFGATFVSADSDNAAIIIKIDGVCEWSSQGISAVGSVHYVGTQNGKWKLSCIGDIVEGLPLDRAVQVKSTPNAVF